MSRNTYMFFVVFLLSGVTIDAQTNDEIPENKYFIGSTFFMLANLVDDPEPPAYYQLNGGYRITAKDVVSIELITWTYYEPLGVPFNKKKTASNYPGKVQSYGAGLAYKRFIWKEAFVQFHATAFHQDYLDKSGRKIQSGFQLFNTLRIGYQFQFFDNRVFLAPSIACTFWPVNTHLPSSFQIQENKWNGFFIGEPGLHFGINF
ncbi:hypothetical protein [Membranihabitans maritimus]|uniref:hypothetical protein n=1 Tax=Membranihabitans maritimus TaxID=2904244 RepID=UPI001F38A0D7|nr:hypothetical protein [Membranihabitans maritimus]